MPKQRTGYVYYDKKRKTWTARLKYKDELGRTRNIRRQVGNKSEGSILLKKLLNDIDQHSSTIIDGAKLTFTKLADIYRDEKLIEPVYEDGVRVASGCERCGPKAVQFTRFIEIGCAYPTNAAFFERSR